MSPIPAQAESPAFLTQQLQRIGPLGFILLLHVGFFYVLKSGLMQQAAPVAPKELVASLISLQATPEPVQPPAPAVPKTVPIVQHAVTPKAPAPVITNKPAPNAITAPPAAATPEPSAPAPVAAAAPPAPAAPAQPKTITSGVEYIQPPQLEYPAAAKRMGEEGRALFRVLVNERGHAERIDLHKTSGSTRLDEAGRQAVARALFKPYMEDGKAISVYVIVPTKFQLD